MPRKKKWWKATSEERKLWNPDAVDNKTTEAYNVICELFANLQITENKKAKTIIQNFNNTNNIGAKLWPNTLQSKEKLY